MPSVLFVASFLRYCLRELSVSHGAEVSHGFYFRFPFFLAIFLFRLLFSAGRCVSGSNQRLRSHLSSSSPSFRALISLDFPSRVIANLNVPCACFCLSLLSHFFHACWLVFSAYFPHLLSGGRDAMVFSSRYFAVS